MNTQEKTIPKSLVKLMEIIHTELTDPQRFMIAEALDDVIEDACRHRRVLSLVQEALGQLRLDMKYLVFDLEATRREKAELEKKLNK